MPFRVLLDENVASGAETELERRGHDAIHVLTTAELGTGTPDEDIVAFVRHTDRLLVTGDAGFLDPDHRHDATVLFCQDDDLRPGELGKLLDLLNSYVAEQANLPPVYHLRRADLERNEGQ